MIAKKKIDFFVEEKVYLNRLLILHFIYEKDSSLLNLFAQNAQCVSFGKHKILKSDLTKCFAMSCARFEELCLNSFHQCFPYPSWRWCNRVPICVIIQFPCLESYSQTWLGSCQYPLLKDFRKPLFIQVAWKPPIANPLFLWLCDSVNFNFVYVYIYGQSLEIFYADVGRKTTIDGLSTEIKMHD